MEFEKRINDLERAMALLSMSIRLNTNNIDSLLDRIIHLSDMLLKVEQELLFSVRIQEKMAKEIRRLQEK